MKSPIKTEDYIREKFEPDRGTDVDMPEGFVKPLFSMNVNPIILNRLKKSELDKERETEIKENKGENTCSKEIDEKENPVAFLRIPEPSKEYFRILQQWAGVVLEVKEDIFTCKLYDMTKDNPQEMAEIPLEELSPDDLSLAKPGGIFYWSIGYHDTSSGTRKRESIIRFRRLPAWNKRELDRAKRESEEVSKELQWGVDASGIDERISG